MPEKLTLPHVKTTAVTLGVRVEWAWPTPIHGTSELELQCLFDDGRLEKRKIKFPINIAFIENLKAGECVQVRLRAIAEDGSAAEWDSHHWIKGQAFSDPVMILDDLHVKMDKPGTFAGEISSQPIKTTYVGELSVGLDVDNKCMVKSTLNGVLVSMLPLTAPNQMISSAGIAAEAIKKAFDHLDKDGASQS